MDSIHNKFKSGNIVEVQQATITRVEYGQICELQAENEELKRALELKHPVLDHMEQDINKIKADAIREALGSLGDKPFNIRFIVIQKRSI